MEVPFNKRPFIGDEAHYVADAIEEHSLSGNGKYTKKCENWFENNLGCKRAILTPSCTAALEMAAILIDIRPGDEVIMPSYTFVSTANAFILRGATVVFIDIRPDTMNINEDLIEQAITEKTKAIVVVHYAGVACEMDSVMALANHHKIYVIEDAAQGIQSYYRNRPLGTIGHIGALSFHDTKNLTSGGEGGLLMINDGQFSKRAEIIRDKGTNRSAFLDGQVDKYTWVDIGSSYLPCELQAAYLWGQLQNVEHITDKRLAIWSEYFRALRELESQELIDLPVIPSQCKHNAHMFYILLRNMVERTDFINHMKSSGIAVAFHYIPLHSSPGAARSKRFSGHDSYTTSQSERLVRLPLFYGMAQEECDFVVSKVKSFFSI